MKYKKSGFSMIELMVLIGGIGILLAFTIAYINPLKRIGESRDARRWTDVEMLAQAIELYATDNSQIPSDFSTAVMVVDKKYVLCSSAGSVTCDGDIHDCLVVDDEDFLIYIESLPIDPSKGDTADTGYYITRKENQGKIAVGACDPYSDTQVIEVISRSALSVGCGNGVLEISLGEVCDSNQTQICDNPAGYYSGAYVEDRSTCNIVDGWCNATCTGCEPACIEEA